MKKLLITLLALLLVFSFAGCAASNNNSDDNKPSTKTTFGLNETATFKNLKVTATEMKESVGEGFFTPDSGNVFVGVKFTIENISDEDQAISTLLLFEAYADDVKCNYSISAAAAFPDGTLDGTVAAGKKLVGWYAVEVPENWKTVELDFKAELLSNKTAKFTFTEADCEESESGSNTGSGTTDTTNPPSTGTALGLNEPASLKNLKVIATEMKESQGESIFKPDSGKVFVGVKFTIENTSNEEQTVSSLLQFTAYVDDVKTGYSFSAVSAFPDGTLDGTIAAGKKLVGWYAVEAPENWKTIELDFQEDLLSSGGAKFVFSK